MVLVRWAFKVLVVWRDDVRNVVENLGAAPQMWDSLTCCDSVSNPAKMWNAK